MNDAFEVRLFSFVDRGVHRRRFPFDRQLERICSGENLGKWRRHLIGAAGRDPHSARASLHAYGDDGVALTESWIGRNRGVGR